MKRPVHYFNALACLPPDPASPWSDIPGLEGQGFFLTLAEDPVSGDYTRLTLFREGCSTQHLGAAAHDYPEEVYIVSGRLHDAAFDLWLEAGHYASRPPGEVHGPFTAVGGDVLVLEVSYPGQRQC